MNDTRQVVQPFSACTANCLAQFESCKWTHPGKGPGLLQQDMMTSQCWKDTCKVQQIELKMCWVRWTERFLTSNNPRTNLKEGHVISNIVYSRSWHLQARWTLWHGLSTWTACIISTANLVGLWSFEMSFWSRADFMFTTERSLICTWQYASDKLTAIQMKSCNLRCVCTRKRVHAIRQWFCTTIVATLQRGWVLCSATKAFSISIGAQQGLDYTCWSKVLMDNATAFCSIIGVGEYKKNMDGPI